MGGVRFCLKSQNRDVGVHLAHMTNSKRRNEGADGDSAASSASGEVERKQKRRGC